MHNYDTSSDAELDIQDIVSYTVEKHGFTQMRDYIAILEQGAEAFRADLKPVPAAVWLLGSGLLALVGVKKRKVLQQRA